MDLSTDQVDVVLFWITHPELAAPIRLSTDIQTDPVIYGARSAWRGADPVTEPYLWVIESASLPGNQDNTPAAATAALENLDREMVCLVRSFATPATVAMAVVLASTPDEVEAEWADLLIMSADIDAGEIPLSISREEIENEYCPAGRMPRDRFPGGCIYELVESLRGDPEQPARPRSRSCGHSMCETQPQISRTSWTTGRSAPALSFRRAGATGGGGLGPGGIAMEPHAVWLPQGRNLSQADRAPPRHPWGKLRCVRRQGSPTPDCGSVRRHQQMIARPSSSEQCSSATRISMTPRRPR